MKHNVMRQNVMQLNVTLCEMVHWTVVSCKDVFPLKAILSVYSLYLSVAIYVQISQWHVLSPPCNVVWPLMAEERLEMYNVWKPRKSMKQGYNWWQMLLLSKREQCEARVGSSRLKCRASVSQSELLRLLFIAAGHPGDLTIGAAC